MHSRQLHMYSVQRLLPPRKLQVAWRTDVAALANLKQLPHRQRWYAVLRLRIDRFSTSLCMPWHKPTCCLCPCRQG